MDNKKPLYWLSDIFLDTSSTKIKIVDLETGNEQILKLDEHETLFAMFNDFQNNKDVEAIQYLQNTM